MKKREQASSLLLRWTIKERDRAKQAAELSGLSLNQYLRSALSVSVARDLGEGELDPPRPSVKQMIDQARASGGGGYERLGYRLGCHLRDLLSQTHGKADVDSKIAGFAQGLSKGQTKQIWRQLQQWFPDLAHGVEPRRRPALFRGLGLALDNDRII